MDKLTKKCDTQTRFFGKKRQKRTKNGNKKTTWQPTEEAIFSQRRKQTRDLSNAKVDTKTQKKNNI